MQRLYVWRGNKLEINCSLNRLHEALQDSKALTWLDLQVTDDLTKYTPMLKDEFHLSRLTLDTIEEEKERSRLVEQSGYFYLVVHGLEFDEGSGETDTPKIDIVFGHNFLVTMHRNELPWLTTLLNSAEKETENPAEHIMARGTARLLHAVLDTLVDSYFPILDTLDELVEDLEDETVADTSNDIQGRIFTTKKSLAQMRRVISPQIEVMNALVNRTGDFIPTEAEPYFVDIHDHLVRTFEVLDSYRDLMSGLLDVHLSTVSNRLNVIMKQLAIISTIFLPITFITGVFGQNFGNSPQVAHDPGGHNFWYVLVFMAVITLGQLVYFKYRKWI